MATKTKESYELNSPHEGERFDIDINSDNEASLFYVNDNLTSTCLLADVPKSEVVLLLKEMIGKLEGE